MTTYAVLGTGSVGQAIGGKLVTLGHEVAMGSRTAGNANAVAWAATAGDGAREGSFADAAAFGDVVVNATSGLGSLAALQAAGADNLAGKLLVDVANPLDFTGGFPPVLSVSNDDSLGEQIQRAFPDARVVKTLNTVTADVMVEPSRLPGRHTMFVSGDGVAAKEQVSRLLQSFGWPADDVIDLGDITTARGAEMYLALWVRLYGAVGSPYFNVSVVRGA
jgi:predicted dinucleotide-binding enzyme